MTRKTIERSSAISASIRDLENIPSSHFTEDNELRFNPMAIHHGNIPRPPPIGQRVRSNSVDHTRGSISSSNNMSSSRFFFRSSSEKAMSNRRRARSTDLPTNALSSTTLPQQQTNNLSFRSLRWSGGRSPKNLIEHQSQQQKPAPHRRSGSDSAFSGNVGQRPRLLSDSAVGGRRLDHRRVRSDDDALFSSTSLSPISISEPNNAPDNESDNNDDDKNKEESSSTSSDDFDEPIPPLPSSILKSFESASPDKKKTIRVSNLNKEVSFSDHCDTSVDEDDDGSNNNELTDQTEKGNDEDGGKAGARQTIEPRRLESDADDVSYDSDAIDGLPDIYVDRTTGEQRRSTVLDRSFVSQSLYDEEDERWMTNPFNCSCLVKCITKCGSRLTFGLTDRQMLIRLNRLVIFGASVQMASAIFLAIVSNDDRKVNRTLPRGVTEEPPGHHWALWDLNSSIYLMGGVALVLFLTSLIGGHIISTVDIVRLVRFLWRVLWFVPLEIFIIVSLFDIHDVTEVYVTHWWASKALGWWRDQFCPNGTENDECIVPQLGGPFFAEVARRNGQNNGEDLWCMFHYQHTDCAAIRNLAQEETRAILLSYYIGNAIWTGLLLVVLVTMIKKIEHIVTKPIVLSSRQSNIPGWLLFPCVGSFTTGFVLLYVNRNLINEERLSVYSIYFALCMGLLVSGALFFIGAMFGWFISSYSIMNNSDKNWKLCVIILFMATMAISTMLLLFIFSTSIVMSTGIAGDIDNTDRGIIACSLDTVNSCSYCNNRASLEECPEWKMKDVVSVLRTLLKQIASLAFIFVGYSISVGRYGMVLRKYVAQYEIDYV